jgi:alanine racemase
MSQKVAPATLMPVLKANAYGLGAVAIGKFLSEKGMQVTGVADIGEALDLSPFFKEIHILGDVFFNELLIAQENGFVCPLTSFSRLKDWVKILGKNTKKLKAQINLDSGMGQLGLKPAEIFEKWEQLKNLENIEIVGLYSHFTNGDFLNDPHSRMQLKVFKEVQAFLEDKKILLKNTHIGNSSAINFMPDSYHGFSHVRTGINIYGVQNEITARENYLKPVLKLTTKIINIKNLSKGDTIGYQKTFKLTENKQVATIPIGYADGMPFGAKENGKVLIKGLFCSILGRVSMDYITVDISHLKNIGLEESVVLIGKEGENEITVEDWASWKQSIPYDIICSLHKPRIIKNYESSK